MGARRRRKDGRSPMDKARIKLWLGVLFVVAGVGFALGFAFVPPHVLIPELIRQPRLSLVPEGLVGLWLVLIGAMLLVSALRRGQRGVRR
jgi:hypothetical protein